MEAPPAPLPGRTPRPCTSNSPHPHRLILAPRFRPGFLENSSPPLPSHPERPEYTHLHMLRYLITDRLTDSPPSSRQSPPRPFAHPRSRSQSRSSLDSLFARILSLAPSLDSSRFANAISPPAALENFTRRLLSRPRSPPRSPRVLINHRADVALVLCRRCSLLFRRCSLIFRRCSLLSRRQPQKNPRRPPPLRSRRTLPRPNPLPLLRLQSPSASSSASPAIPSTTSAAPPTPYPTKRPASSSSAPSLKNLSPAPGLPALSPVLVCHF